MFCGMGHLVQGNSVPFGGQRGISLAFARIHSLKCNSISKTSRIQMNLCTQLRYFNWSNENYYYCM